jgi:hypothetical protein
MLVKTPCSRESEPTSVVQNLRCQVRMGFLWSSDSRGIETYVTYFRYFQRNCLCYTGRYQRSGHAGGLPALA